MAYPGTKQTMMKYFAAQLVEYYEEIANAAEAPEPLPEHRAAVLALLRARGVLPPADDGGDGGDGGDGEQGGC